MSETQQGAGGPTKSAAQARYDRMRLQCNRFNAIRRQLDGVRDTIAASEQRPPGTAPSTEPPPGQMPQSFFAGLDLLLDANDRIADGLEATVKGLSALF